MATSKTWTLKQLKKFHAAAESLKLYRRADLVDAEQGGSIVEELYVDPLPNEQLLQMALRPNTTFLIGRKGTGKSTIFQRLQYEFQKSGPTTSAYLDIKTIYESSQIDPELYAKIADLESALPAAELEKIFLHREFLKSVIFEIKSELRKRLEGSLYNRLKEFLTESVADALKEIDKVLADIDNEQFINVLGLRLKEVRAKSDAANSNSANIGAGASVSTVIGGKLDISASNSSTISLGSESSHTELLLAIFPLKSLIIRLKEILVGLKIRNLYILIDDFSELPLDAMRVIIDVLIAPLNNWSDEFVKFKIAAYPGRIYFGQLDRTKIDEISLDSYDLYGSGDVARMEDSAIDFTKRLVSKRLTYFCGAKFFEFFDEDFDEICRLLFFSTMANPRNLGWILSYGHESYLVHGKPIGVRAIREAAQRYFEEKIDSYLKSGKFLQESFEERSSIYSLKELLEQIVNRARELRRHESDVMKKIKGRPPTSHFHVAEAYEKILSTLELNFFITRYFQMANRDGKKVTVYSLNYGLCQAYSIEFGRPTGEREFRLYFVERIFDYTPIIQKYIKSSQEIICDHCGKSFEFEQLDALRFYNMRCPKCRDGVCKVTNLSRKYEKELREVDANSLLPRTELGILQTLHTEGQATRVTLIAGELDCSYQLIGKRGKILDDRGLVKRSENEQGKRLFTITESAEELYFGDAGPSLDLEQE